MVTRDPLIEWPERPPLRSAAAEQGIGASLATTWAQALMPSATLGHGADQPQQDGRQGGDQRPRTRPTQRQPKRSTSG